MSSVTEPDSDPAKPMRKKSILASFLSSFATHNLDNLHCAKIQTPYILFVLRGWLPGHDWMWKLLCCFRSRTPTQLQSPMSTLLHCSGCRCTTTLAHGSKYVSWHPLKDKHNNIILFQASVDDRLALQWANCRWHGVMGSNVMCRPLVLFWVLTRNDDELAK